MPDELLPRLTQSVHNTGFQAEGTGQFASNWAKLTYSEQNEEIKRRLDQLVDDATESAERITADFISSFEKDYGNTRSLQMREGFLHFLDREVGKDNIVASAEPEPPRRLSHTLHSLVKAFFLGS